MYSCGWRHKDPQRGHGALHLQYFSSSTHANTHMSMYCRFVRLLPAVFGCRGGGSPVFLGAWRGSISSGTGTSKRSAAWSQPSFSAILSPPLSTSPSLYPQCCNVRFESGHWIWALYSFLWGLSKLWPSWWQMWWKLVQKKAKHVLISRISLFPLNSGWMDGWMTTFCCREAGEGESGSLGMWRRRMKTPFLFNQVYQTGHERLLSSWILWKLLQRKLQLYSLLFGGSSSPCSSMPAVWAADAVWVAEGAVLDLIVGTYSYYLLAFLYNLLPMILLVWESRAKL